MKESGALVAHDLACWLAVGTAYVRCSIICACVGRYTHVCVCTLRTTGGIIVQRCVRAAGVCVCVHVDVMFTCVERFRCVVVIVALTCM